MRLLSSRFISWWNPLLPLSPGWRLEDKEGYYYSKALIADVPSEMKLVVHRPGLCEQLSMVSAPGGAAFTEECDCSDFGWG